MSRSWVREPLVHFLLAGAAIFAVTALWPGGGDTRTIRIDRQQLTEYLLARARISERGQFEAYYRSLSPEARGKLLQDAAGDEALYREGLSIGLDRADPLVRQRIIQQMRELLEDEAATHEIADAALADYYEQHRGQYRRDDTVTFAHVFFAGGGDAAESGRRARLKLEQLRAASVPAAEAASHGERFLYETFNRDVDNAAVTAKFGAEFATALFALEPGAWQGPLRSEHGWHLVFLTEHVPGHVPTMEQLGSRLREDALEAQRAAAANAALERLLGDYRIVTELPE